MELERLIKKFKDIHILVVGDLILDEYIWTDAERISPEAPVPVLLAKKRSFLPGGAANVASNLACLGAKVSLSGVVGEDKNAKILFDCLGKRRVNLEAIFSDSGRCTTLKTRLIAEHQQVARLDWESREPIDEGLNRKIFNYVKKNIANIDAIIVEDYGKGVINPSLLSKIIPLANRYKKIVTVDPKEDHFLYYQKVTCITPNRKELENAIRNLKFRDKSQSFRFYNDRLCSDKDIIKAAKEIIRYLNLKSLLVTLGKDGMFLFEKDKSFKHIPTLALEVYDVSGAGDTVIAVFTLGLACNLSFYEASRLANLAAGIVVGKFGTATVSVEELLERKILLEKF
ncbi:MAG: D-glycero-beta-D-manno-heptose-7-phosphate kinase [Candidatus Omnitrophica bacterium]|nr:D-glycero-beta-D-manno-heptose-7-phosphate kinase [Candidatus Omnitrophota bacterium]